jgi:hypothetical protein
MSTIHCLIGRWRAGLSALRCFSFAGLVLAGTLPAVVLVWAGSLWPGQAGAQPQPQPQPHAALSMASAEQALLDAINDYRSAQGRARWLPDARLAQVARGHSRSMAAAGRLAHDGFERRAARTGSDLCVENLLRGQVAPARAVHLWMQSPAHHDNLLESEAVYAGVGQVGQFVTLLACASRPVPRVPGMAENAETGAGGR